MIETQKLLPLGSIVILREGTKKLMIDGYYLVDQGKTYDYGAVLYPEGRLDNQVYVFDHDKIAQVVSRGFEDEERVEHLVRMAEWKKKEEEEDAAEEEKRQRPKTRLPFWRREKRQKDEKGAT